ncbi:response regulator [Pseudomonas sp.]|uniref:response regulator n=1 Tax=Pseudomonas sp. TaxID=306 RepID=UPI0028A5FFA9|nr:response regulator [Pseudomonas sp.]
MACSFSLEERALILAPSPRADRTLELLSKAGFGCAVTRDMTHLGEWLGEGAAMAIIDEHSLASVGNSALQNFVEHQPSWSDLPVLLLCAPTSASSWSQFGNLFALSHPCQDQQLLGMVQAALRARQRQYQSRDQQHASHQALHLQLELTRRHQETLQNARKMDAIGHLAGGVAHDFNNLLTSIGGSLELAGRRLQRGQADAVDTALDIGRQAVGRAARLTHRLLAFSSRQSLQSQRVDVAELLQSTAWRDSISPAITVNCQFDEDLWWAQTDAAQLRESFDNLILNACEAMPCGGSLLVEAHNQTFAEAQFAASLPAGDYVCLSLTDTGQGMSASTLEHAFEPFFSTKPTGQGIGLGLSMVYGFSKQSQGHVVLTSAIGQGTQVQLYVPRHSDRAEPAAQAETQAGASTVPPKPARQRSNGNVLIVEDDEQVRGLLQQSLAEEGLTCHCAADAEQALALLRSQPNIELLISDVGLPGMNGRQLAEIARMLLPSLKVLFVTGYAETAMARDQFLDPGMELMCKPFTMQRLRERVGLMLQCRIGTGSAAD